ncbi:MAG: hypothetical protein PSV13_01180 [Lacunisphaera sp.]|nr:hypothetical protein [Lacunisphaera sp.]
METAIRWVKPALREHARRTPADNLVEKHARASVLGRADDQRALVDPFAVALDVGLEKQGGAVGGHRVHHEAHGLLEPFPPHRERLAQFGHVGQRRHRTGTVDPAAGLHPRDRIGADDLPPGRGVDGCRSGGHAGKVWLKV